MTVANMLFSIHNDFMMLVMMTVLTVTSLDFLTHSLTHSLTHTAHSTHSLAAALAADRAGDGARGWQRRDHSRWIPSVCTTSGTNGSDGSDGSNGSDDENSDI